MLRCLGANSWFDVAEWRECREISRSALRGDSHLFSDEKSPGASDEMADASITDLAILAALLSERRVRPDCRVKFLSFISIR
jgi:hypothetical protein